jgi:hypothetical protein
MGDGVHGTQSRRVEAAHKLFAFGIIRLVRALSSNLWKAEYSEINGYDPAPPVGASYRAVCRARSRPEFLAKLGVLIERAE